MLSAAYRISARFACIFLLYTVVIGCSNNRAQEHNLLTYVPKNSALVIQLNDPTAVQSQLKNNALIAQAIEHQLFGNLHQKWNAVADYSTLAPILLSITEVGKESYEFTQIARMADQPLDSLAGNKTSFVYNNHNGYSYQRAGIDVFETTFDSLRVTSTSKLLLENAIRNYQNTTSVDPILKEAFASANTNKALNVFGDAKRLRDLSKAISGIAFFDDHDSWLMLDAQLENSNLLLSGIQRSTDSLGIQSNWIAAQKPQSSELLNTLPASITSAALYSIQDQERFYQELEGMHQPDEATARYSSEVYKYGDELALIEFKGASLVLLHTVDPENVLPNLPLATTSIPFRNTEIFELEGVDEASDFRILTPQGIQTLRFVSRTENTLLFAEQLNTMKEFMANTSASTNMLTTELYEAVDNSVSDAHSFLWLGTNPQYQEFMVDSASSSFAARLKKMELSEYPVFAIQQSADTQFNHTIVSIPKNKPAGKSGTISQSASIQLDANLATNPQWVLNHRNQQQEIVVQDTDNQLYLIDCRGNVLWKKALGEPIIGAIQQMDIYKNGRLQLVFATNKKVYVLDRNGKEVSPFPLEMDKIITQPLALFDYDGNKNYRLLVTMGSHLKMFDRNAKSVNGFTFNKASSAIVKIPKHFRIGAKDYLTFAESSGKLHILDRRGRERVKVNTTIDFSENDIFSHQNKFVTTDNNGKLISINTLGGIDRKDLGLEQNHGFQASTRALVTQSENELRINGKKVTLDFGIYTKPLLVYVHNKLYVAITDLQAHQVYLFDSQGKLIPNFPVYGKDMVALADADNDRRLELVVKGEEDTLLIYDVN